MEQFLIDTNAISDYLSAAFTAKAMRFLDDVINAVPKISIISQIELLCWNTDEATGKNVKSFINDSTVINITSQVVEQCVAIRKSKKIKTPDAIIAASAMSLGYTLITNNEKDFGNIKGLKCINPHKL